MGNRANPIFGSLKLPDLGLSKQYNQRQFSSFNLPREAHILKLYGAVFNDRLLKVGRSRLISNSDEVETSRFSDLYMCIKGHHITTRLNRKKQ